MPLLALAKRFLIAVPRLPHLAPVGPPFRRASARGAYGAASALRRVAGARSRAGGRALRAGSNECLKGIEPLRNRSEAERTAFYATDTSPQGPEGHLRRPPAGQALPAERLRGWR